MNTKKLVGTLAAMAVVAIAPASAVASPEDRHLEQISMGVKAPEPSDPRSAIVLENIQITSGKAPEPPESIPADDRMKYYLESAWTSKVEISALTGSKTPAGAMWIWHEAARNGIHDARTPADANSSEVAVEGLTLAVEPAHITALDQDMTTVRASAGRPPR